MKYEEEEYECVSSEGCDIKGDKNTKAIAIIQMSLVRKKYRKPSRDANRNLPHFPLPTHSSTSTIHHHAAPCITNRDVQQN
jgi:hypothetical protein